MKQDLKPSWLFALSAFLLINSLFIVKYAMRLVDAWLACSLALGYIATVVVLLRAPLLGRLSEKRWAPALLIAYGIGIEVVQYSIDPYGLQVDRWSAIDGFLSLLFKGEYPYAANTHLDGYGSPFPVWQLFHIPFFLVGNVGLSWTVCLVVFLFSVHKLTGSRSIAGVTAALLMMSVSLNYEIVVRSDLYANSLLAAAVCNYLMAKKVELRDHVIAIGVVSGCLLGTRLTAVLPLALLYGLQFLRIGWLKRTVFCLTVVATVVVIFLPFALWNTDMFFGFQYSPFRLQTHLGSPYVALAFAVVAVALALKTTADNFHLLCGLMLNVLPLLAYVHLRHPDLTFLDFDLTYFNMALPFYAVVLSRAYSQSRQADKGTIAKTRSTQA